MNKLNEIYNNNAFHGESQYQSAFNQYEAMQNQGGLGGQWQSIGSGGALVAPPTIEQEIQRAEQQVEILKHARLRDMAPTLEEAKKFPALMIAYNEYLLIRNLTLGTK